MRAGGTGGERAEPVHGGPAHGAHGHGSGTGHGAGGDATGADLAYLALERELAVFLRRARASSGEMAREVHPGLEPAAYGLLVRLDEAGGQRATELAGYFGVGKATMSRQLRALEELGLVVREPDPADGRASLVRLTGEGRDRFRRVRDARRARYVRKLAGWDRAEVAELARLLHQLNTGSEPRDPRPGPERAPDSAPGPERAPGSTPGPGGHRP
ncbi:MarR family winged helix-turn-helix transcriptional regulator [Streptomyces sp. SS162]|uniref:MarR family winged helix-turn-helix transcriptional regulator n=1 Tax=Streptomyces sp. SS162 TaxID=3108484 RepID=UPI002F3E2B14